MNGKTTNLLFGTGLIFLALSSIGIERSSAAVITSFQDALVDREGRQGWNFYWNRWGPIGDPANYASLNLLDITASPDVYYTTSRSQSFPAPAPGAFAYFGNLHTSSDSQSNTGPGGHPGQGSSQDLEGIERYVIAGYTVSENGFYALTDLTLTNVDFTFESTDGLSLRVFFNDNQLFSGFTAAGYESTLSRNRLGSIFLQRNDTIYVAIGSRGEDFGDSFSLRYNIELETLDLAPLSFSPSVSPLSPLSTSTPEPSTILGLLSLFSIGLVRSRGSSDRSR